MARLGSIIAGLSGRSGVSMGGGLIGPDVLTDINAFGSNPGTLRGRCFIPDNLAAGAPLVVVLHGCTQTAAGYDRGAGWSRLANEMGFALLFPEQQRTNNANLCFNWFSPVDTKRGSGEVLSIRQMIAHMVAVHAIDDSRIFVTGLSAGGAMTSIMLAAYPEVFAGGAIIAGLPYGAATSMGDAFARMRGDGYPSEKHTAGLVRDATGHAGPWPMISVWQGGADATVHRSNAERIISQWQTVYGIENQAPERDIVDGAAHRTWRAKSGKAVIEAYDIDGMGHGTPLDSNGPDGIGVSGPFMLEAGISSTRHIACFWGLADERISVKAATPATSESMLPASGLVPEEAPEPFPTGLPAATGGVGAIIEDALRKAGLMR